MKTFLEDLGRKIGETAEIVTSKAGEAVEIQKLRNQIRALERACERDYMDLGRTVYEHYKDGEVIDAEAIGICEAIQNREESIEKYEQQVAEVKGDAKCEGCGKTVSKEMSYCPYCGEKVPEYVKNEETTEEPKAEEPSAEETKAEDPTTEAPNVKEQTIEEEVKEHTDAMKEKVVDMAGKVREKTEDAADLLKEKSSMAADIVKEKAAEAAEAVKEKAKEAEEKIKSMTEE